MIFYEHKLLTLKRDHVQFNLFNSIINVAAVDWFLFASNPTGRCFSHSFDLLSVQHGTYILQMLLRIYTRSLHQSIFFLSSMKKKYCGKLCFNLIVFICLQKVRRLEITLLINMIRQITFYCKKLMSAALVSIHGKISLVMSLLTWSCPKYWFFTVNIHSSLKVDHHRKNL